MDGQIIKSQRAKVLVQALPYIQKYWNRVVVIKYGGHAMESEELKRQVMEDIVLLQLVGVKVVLVHGGGPEINDLLSKLGVKSEFVNGLRVTDEETAQIVQMVLAGKVGKSLVNLIESTGGKAMGICGIDGKLIEAKSKSPALGYVGDITRVNVGPINDLLEKGYIPVAQIDFRKIHQQITAAQFQNGIQFHAVFSGVFIQTAAGIAQILQQQQRILRQTAHIQTHLRQRTIPLAADEHILNIHARDYVQIPIPFNGQIHKTHIHTAIAQQAQRFVSGFIGDFDADIREVLMVLLQIRQQKVSDNGITGANLQFPRFHVEHLKILIFCRLNKPHSLGQIGIECFSFRRGINAPCRPHQQFSAHPFL